ncbi:DUF6207 family protein [Streptomyces sp. NPDC057543]|uniref:DUF6207 family protein n=1 Tax=Streptomyces sp. NPDC057543 TaxID=3346163 RepID=UPI0036981A37
MSRTWASIGSTGGHSTLRPVGVTDEQHLTEPGLVVLNVTADDEHTIRAVMDSLPQRWATSRITPARRSPGGAA